MKSLCLALAACGLLSAGAARAADKFTPNDLKQIGLAYHNYHDVTGKGPAKGDDLKPYFDEKDQKRFVEALNLGQVVFQFNVGIRDMVDGTSNTVLAYDKDVPKEGGLVLYGDASVKKLTADEFKKAILAKPKEKPKDK
jgi:hypothetical protein